MRDEEAEEGGREREGEGGTTKKRRCWEGGRAVGGGGEVRYDVVEMKKQTHAVSKCNVRSRDEIIDCEDGRRMAYPEPRAGLAGEIRLIYVCLEAARKTEYGNLRVNPAIFQTQNTQLLRKIAWLGIFPPPKI